MKKQQKEAVVKINKTKSWFFEKINKIARLLARLIKKKREEVVVHICNGILLSQRKERIWINSSEVGEPIACYSEWNKNKHRALQKFHSFLFLTTENSATKFSSIRHVNVEVIT